MRFPPEFIERLRSMVVLSEVVGRRVALKRAGREYHGLCPFHHEKTPSFTVNDEKGFYHCFGCGAHGDAIRFLTDNEGMSYPDAIERLSGEVGLALPQSTPQQAAVARQAASLHDVMEAACQWFQRQLADDQGGRVARAYLRERGLTASTLRTFRLGFAPPERDALKRFLAQQGISERQMMDAGLLIRPDQGNTYDRFRARLMFPITDKRGKVVAFGGRILPELSEPGRSPPKYLNSPETQLFHKGELLYGHALAQQAAHKAGTVLVTEGYMDVIALHQAGIRYAVAPLGTSVTEGHVRLLWQLADEPVLCLDGDAAGQRAMHRAAELCLPLLRPGKSLRFLILPKGEDPDSFIRKQGSEAFDTLLCQAIPLSDALWDQHAGDMHRASPEKRAAVEHTLMQLVEKMQDKTVSSHFRAYFRKRLWPERQPKNQQDTSSLRSRSLEHYMREGEQAQLYRREKELLKLVLSSSLLLEQGEVEEAFARFHFTNTHHEAIRHAVLEAWAEYGNCDKATLETFLSGKDERALLQELCPLAPQLEESAVDTLRPLRQWQLLASEHTLTHMQAECRQLEAELAEDMGEETYNRLVALKRQIMELQQDSLRLRNALDS